MLFLVRSDALGALVGWRLQEIAELLVSGPIGFDCVSRTMIVSALCRTLDHRLMCAAKRTVRFRGILAPFATFVPSDTANGRAISG